MRDEERVRRLFDGELAPHEETSFVAEATTRRELAEQLDDTRVLVEHLAAARAESIEPPDTLVERSVRRAVREREAYETQPLRWLDWLWTPRAIRMRPLSMIGTAAVLGFGAAIALRDAADAHERHDVVAPSPERRPTQARPIEAPAPAASIHDSTRRSGIPVRFVLPAKGAVSVAVAGDFNDWRANAAPLGDPDGDGTFTGTLHLPVGSHAYMFVVDGERWIPDPYAETFRDDGFGNRNAVLRID